MKHIFIINPAAGKGNAYEQIRKELESLQEPVDYALYQTRATGDATLMNFGTS